MRKYTSIPFAEAVAAVLIAIIVEFANSKYFGKSELGTLLAIQTGFIGVLLSIQRLNLDESRQREQARIDKVAEYLDVQQDASYNSIRALGERFGSITEAEFTPVKDQIVADAQEQLRRLAIEKRSATLQTTHYYDWLFKQFERSNKNEYMHAVSLSSDEEWNDSQLEQNFLKANVQAAGRGVEVCRIFIVADDRVAQFMKLPPIQKHSKSSGSGLVGYLVSRNELEKYDPQVLRSVGQGFVDFNGKVGLEDIFDPQGAARGQVTMLPEDLERMLSIYNRLLNMAKVIE